MKASVVYEENVPLNIEKAFELSMQWLKGTHKAKIKKSNPPRFIEAKQGTMMTNTGHDPNWKKRIRMNFYLIEQNQTLIRIEAIALSRNIIRVEKLKRSWYDGLFSRLFTLLQNLGIQSSQKQELNKICPFCGSKIEEYLKICSSCGTNLN